MKKSLIIIVGLMVGFVMVTAASAQSLKGEVERIYSSSKTILVETGTEGSDKDQDIMIDLSNCTYKGYKGFGDIRKRDIVKVTYEKKGDKYLAKEVEKVK